MVIGVIFSLITVEVKHSLPPNTVLPLTRRTSAANTAERRVVENAGPPVDTAAAKRARASAAAAANEPAGGAAAYSLKSEHCPENDSAWP